jgi:hypothetical protein
MEKWYQVFISSTRSDLQDERRAVADTLLRSRYIPIGMEQFPAASEDAWSLIRRYLDECDYYIVIVGNAYGSTRPDGISYTEAEYDYAVSRGIPILAFLYQGNDAQTPQARESNTQPPRAPEREEEQDPEKRNRLLAFRRKIERGRVRDTWSDKYELAFKVGSALDKVVRDYPAIGWIRGDVIPERVLGIIQSVAEPCNRLGITRVSEDGVAGEAMKHMLSSASSIRILSSSAFRLLDTYRGAMTDAFSNGCSVRVLIPKPGSQFLVDLEEFEAVHVGRGLSLDTELDIIRVRLLEALSEAAVNIQRTGLTLGRAEVGYFTTHLRSTMVLCDKSWGWLTITLPPFRATETVSMELGPTSGRPLLQTCVDHFDRIWEIVEERGEVEVLHPAVLTYVSGLTSFGLVSSRRE